MVVSEDIRDAIRRELAVHEGNAVGCVVERSAQSAGLGDTGDAERARIFGSVVVVSDR